jgi:PAS domain S-box-containing protein
MIPPAPLRHRRLLEWTAYGGLLAAAAAGLLALQHHELQRYTALETARLDNLAGVVATNIQTDLDATNHALMSVVRGVRAAPAAAQNAELVKLVSVMPGVRSMAVLDRDGVVLASDQADVLGRALGARAYFQLARNRPQADTLYVSAPFHSLRGDLVITLSRVIPAPDGSFAGLALATLDPEYFTAKFRSAHYTPDSWAYVVHGGGIQLLNYPAKGDIDGSDLSRPGSLFQRHRAQGAAASVQQGRVITTAEWRLMALRTIQPPALQMDQPIVIGVSRELAAIAAPLQAQGRSLAALWGGVALAGALSLALAQRRRALVQRLRDEQQAERERLEVVAGSERRFRTLIEDAPLPIAMLRHGQIIYTNPRYRALHGYAPDDDLTGLPWPAMLAEQSRQALQREAALIAADSPQELRFEALGLDKAGRLVPVLKATARVALADGDATLVFAQDISAQKRAEAELTLARDAAEAGGRAKADFLANMSHEIRSPLNAILGLAYLLERARLAPEAQDTVRKLGAAGRALLGIVNDILDVSKIDAGHMALEHTPFRLDEVIEHVASSMGLAVADRAVEVIVDAVPAGVATLVGDALRLQQVLTNLCANAIKFTPAGQVLLGVQRLDGPAGAARLAFSVRDTGIGIDAALHAAIFAPFSQADSSITRRFGGTGLGLTICRQLVRLMGGELVLHSAPGAGSEFSFVLTLPLPAEAPPAVELRGMRLLVADDSMAARAAVTALARRLGATVVEAGSAEQLQALWRDGDGCDAALLTLRMAEHIDTATATCPLLLMAPPYALSLLAQSAGSAGLSQPVTRAGLLAALRAPPLPAQPGQQLQGIRLLVVDDSEINREVIERITRHEGAMTYHAADGQAALDWLTAHPGQVDVVLMDVQMPVMDGIEATRRIRALPPLAGLPIIALTAGAFTSQQAAAMAAGMNHFISKPFDVGATLALIRRVALGGAAAPAPAAIPAMAEAIDAAQGLALWGDAEHHHDMLGRFARGYAGVAEAIARRAGSGDIAGAAALAHRLAGLSASLALRPLCHQAQQAERQLRAGSDTGAVAGVGEQLRRVLAAIGALGPQRLPAAIPSSCSTAELLGQLLTALPADDPSPLEPLLLQLQTRLPPAQWQRLQALVLAFDSAAAVTLAQTLAADTTVAK